jgi:hypothetical protein
MKIYSVLQSNKSKGNKHRLGIKVFCLIWKKEKSNISKLKSENEVCLLNSQWGYLMTAEVKLNF